jgi:hypothetical protein
VGNYNATLQQLFGNASADSQAAARYNNPFTSLFGGALSGFSTGLSLGQSFGGGSSTWGTAQDWNDLGAAVRYGI